LEEEDTNQEATS